jgi:hypothetical protein
MASWKINPSERRKVMKRTAVFYLALFFCGMAFMLSGCSSSGGDDIAFDGPVTDVVGFQFTEDNMWDAALIGIEPFMVFYDISRIIAAIIEEIEGQDALDTGSGQLGDVLCNGEGTAALSWSGVRDQGSVILVFDSCNIDDGLVSGEMLFSDTLYDEEGKETLTAQVLMGLTVQEELDGEIVDMNVDGNFLLRMFRESNETTKLGFRYGGADEDPDAWFELSEDGNQLQLGCFDVSISFDPEASEGTFLLGDVSISTIYGVVIVNEKLILVRTGPGAPGSIASLVFEDGVPVTSGAFGSMVIDYWGFLLKDLGYCAVLGVPEGVGEGGTANMTLRIIGDTPLVGIELYPDGFAQEDPPLLDARLWFAFIAD